MASAAPPVRFPNVYGIDMPTKDELVAHDRSIEEIRQLIGCDALIYQDVDAMKRAVMKAAPAKADTVTIAGFEASCFDGVYVTGDIDTDAISRMNGNRPRIEETEEDSSRLVLPNLS
jgi:amidophosphoribosyltransferase